MPSWTRLDNMPWRLSTSATLHGTHSARPNFSTLPHFLQHPCYFGSWGHAKCVPSTVPGLLLQADVCGSVFRAPTMVLHPLMHVLPSCRCGGSAVSFDAARIHVLIAARDL